jgi:Holliday junction resolvasome RuvABC ATP-dependent DNA helicase subunit
VLSATLNMDVSEVRNDVEPYLMMAGLLARRSNGRCATKDTYTVLGLPVPPMVNGALR